MAGLKIERYSPVNMSLVDADATGVDFGDAIKGQHCSNVVAIRPVAVDITFTALALFLENTNGVNHTEFGKYHSAVATPGITPGSNYLSDAFVPITGISDAAMIGMYSDYGIMFDSTDPEYAWMDAEIGTAENMLGSSTINFRFVFEYN